MFLKLRSFFYYVEKQMEIVIRKLIFVNKKNSTKTIRLLVLDFYEMITD